MLSILFLLCCVIVHHSLATFDPTTHPNWHLLKNRNCDPPTGARMLGADVANLMEYPWMAVLTAKSVRIGRLIKYTCPGSILNKRVLLTAAQCVAGLYETIPDGYKFRDESGKTWGIYIVRAALGEYKTNANPDCDDRNCAEKVQRIKVHEVIYHASYNKSFLSHDIALVRLASDIQFHSSVWPICLPRGYLMEENFTNLKATVAGWGLVNTKTQRFSNLLRKLVLQVHDNSYCIPGSDHFDGELEICASDQKINSGPCRGDYGGPLMFVDEQLTPGRPRFFVIGIVSHPLHYICGVGAPVVLTRVTAFMPWILDNLVENRVEFIKEEWHK